VSFSVSRKALPSSAISVISKERGELATLESNPKAASACYMQPVPINRDSGQRACDRDYWLTCVPPMDLPPIFTINGRVHLPRIGEAYSPLKSGLTVFSP
jgi:hypothetical protein